MDESTLETSKTFIGDVYLDEDGARIPVRINDNGWLKIMRDAPSVLPTTLWFGCYHIDGEDTYVIKEYANGGMLKGPTAGISDNGYLGFYKSDPARRWLLSKADGEILIPRETPEAHFCVSTKGGRKWTAEGDDCIARKGSDSSFLLHIHKVGVYRF